MSDKQSRQVSCVGSFLIIILRKLGGGFELSPSLRRNSTLGSHGSRFQLIGASLKDYCLLTSVP